MYSIIEKVIFLQDIDIFMEVRMEDLSYLALISEEVHYMKDQHLYKVNESADALFLVINGKVRLHRDGQEINTICSLEAMGTWSLFDNQPRVATATALEDTETLRISRDDFYDLLSDHVKIAEAVLRSLSRKLRAIVERVS